MPQHGTNEMQILLVEVSETSVDPHGHTPTSAWMCFLALLDARLRTRQVHWRATFSSFLLASKHIEPWHGFLCAPRFFFSCVDARENGVVATWYALRAPCRPYRCRRRSGRVHPIRARKFPCRPASRLSLSPLRCRRRCAADRLSSPSQVACQSSPFNQVTPVTNRLDSIVRSTAPVSGSI